MKTFLNQRKGLGAIALVAIAIAGAIIVVAVSMPQVERIDTAAPTVSINSPTNMTYPGATQLLSITTTDDTAITAT